MICIPTRDKKIIKSLLKKVSDKAFEDDIDLSSWEPDMAASVMWLVIRDSKQVFGVCKMTFIQKTMADFHPYAMPGQCNKWKSIVKCILRWVYKSGKINKIISFIGAPHKTTYKLALKIGFNDEGLVRKSYLKNGELHDQYIVGLTRDEIGKII